jgi:hypothetical protein
MEKRCGRCGGALTCNPAGDCWCKRLPHGQLPREMDAAECLCQDCLTRELRAQGHEVAGRDAKLAGDAPARAGNPPRRQGGNEGFR